LQAEVNRDTNIQLQAIH